MNMSIDTLEVIHVISIRQLILLSLIHPGSYGPCYNGVPVY